MKFEQTKMRINVIVTFFLKEPFLDSLIIKNFSQTHAESNIFQKKAIQDTDYLWFRKEKHKARGR